MVRKELSETEIAESIPDLWQPLTQEQREFLGSELYDTRSNKKNETIYCEGETPMHLMCLLSGKVKIYKEGVGGRSQIIRVLKTKEYFAYRAFFCRRELRDSCFRFRALHYLPYSHAGHYETDKRQL